MGVTVKGNRPVESVSVPSLEVGLLGGFRVERADAGWPVSGWQRRSAKTLTKLLATYPRHALHREQVVEILWPDVDFESALNSFGKTLYAARRAFQPELLPRQSSAYLRLTDSMLALNTDYVAIDADNFQQLAESALRQGDVKAYESALASYGGELLPEDRYEDWCAERRDFLAALHLRLLVELAQALEKRGSFAAAIDRFREVLQHDPTREDVHRRLMVLYAGTGSRDRAVRQFQVCEEVLSRELGLAPEKATVALHEDVLANRIPRRIPVPEPDRATGPSPRPRAAELTQHTPLVGREQVLRRLGDELTRADAGKGRTVLLRGEAGVGKTRALTELAAEARRRGATVLWGGSGAHATGLPYAPFAVALDAHTAGPLDPERIVRLLGELARRRPAVLVVGDLHDLDRSSLDLLQHLAHLAGQRRWLILGSVREEDLEVGSDLWRVIENMAREGLCLDLGVGRLPRADCDLLVRALLPGGRVDELVLAHIYARSLGNPLFVEELVREMLERGELLPALGCWRTTSTRRSDRVPARARTLVAMRVASLDESARQVLALAAAARGVAISLSDLRAGGAVLDPPVSDAGLFDALDRALDMQLLEERNDGYAFRHPLVRAALFDDLSRHRREQLRAALDGSAAEPRCVPA
jgi:DNA-binding SARP family transcriptional activator